jgi:hypothetical protein
MLSVRLRSRFGVSFASCAELDAIVWVSIIRARNALMEKEIGGRSTISLLTEAYLSSSFACCDIVEAVQLTKNKDGSRLLYSSWRHRSTDHVSHVNVGVGSNVV